ncbi:unnamed protein product [Phytophthora lilii]|uniref:Unnamed protein product n=1 Tax=Phytophthora lilii TaxID=2077276 RepID=A0A9W6WMM1_9STRA|nr:unnamed protein product [Phytophthora lilii]
MSTATDELFNQGAWESEAGGLHLCDGGRVTRCGCGVIATQRGSFGLIGLLLLAGWGDVLSNISPYAWGSMGVAFGLAFSIVGAAWCEQRGPKEPVRDTD